MICNGGDVPACVPASFKVFSPESLVHHVNAGHIAMDGSMSNTSESDIDVVTCLSIFGK